MAISVLTVSSKGQIALPAKLRKEMSIQTGDQLALYATDGVIMLKPVKLPTKEEFLADLKEAEQWAREVGYTEDDVSAIIKEVRERKMDEGRD